MAHYTNDSKDDVHFIEVRSINPSDQGITHPTCTTIYLKNNNKNLEKMCNIKEKWFESDTGHYGAGR